MTARLIPFPTHASFHVPSNELEKLAHNLMLASKLFFADGRDESGHDLMEAAGIIGVVGGRLKTEGL